MVHARRKLLKYLEALHFDRLYTHRHTHTHTHTHTHQRKDINRKTVLIEALGIRDAINLLPKLNPKPNTTLH
jgi:hypothetical protein